MKKIFFLIFINSVFLLFLYTIFFNFSKIHFVEVQVEQEVQQEPAYIIKQPEILAYLNSYKKKYLWQIDLNTMIQKMESMYIGLDISIRRKYPHRLLVFLNRKATFLILLKSNHSFYSISYNGDLGVQKTTKDSLNFPILRGDFFEENLELRQRVLKLLAQIPETGQGFSYENISEILYNKANDSLLLYLYTGLFVLELKSIPSNKKIQNIDFVLSYLKEIGQDQAFIDARLDKKIIVKKK